MDDEVNIACIELMSETIVEVDEKNDESYGERKKKHYLIKQRRYYW